MHTRNLALLAALAITGGAAAAFTPQASAQVSIGISVGTPPPPMPYEAAPPPRAGYVWAPGYWNWSGQRYIWVRGTWYRNRPGYVYYHPVGPVAAIAGITAGRTGAATRIGAVTTTTAVTVAGTSTMAATGMAVATMTIRIDHTDVPTQSPALVAGLFHGGACMLSCSPPHWISNAG